MPVRFEIHEGIPHVVQSFDFPSVYLDHWAIRCFSSDGEKGNRFLRALKASGGALVVSHTNLAELTGPADLRHAEEVAIFLESVLPNIYFAMFDTQQAIIQESKPRNSDIRLMAPPDRDLLMAIGRANVNDFKVFSIANVVKLIARNRDTLSPIWRNSNQELADHINRARHNPETIKKARNFAGHSVQVPTLAVIQELLRPVFLDKTFAIDRNDVGDIQHAIMSIVYCDYALLDGKWEHQHKRMRSRFADLRLSIRTAKVFSARKGGVERFLEALEGVRNGYTDTTFGVRDTRQ
jgi:hypothetical protein